MPETGKDPFTDELEHLINKYSLENQSDTPDFILARYLKMCLDNYNAAIQQREHWYGRSITSILK